MTRAHAVVQQARVYPVLMEPVSYFGQTDSEVCILKAELDRVHVASREGGGRAAKNSPPPFTSTRRPIPGRDSLKLSSGSRRRRKQFAADHVDRDRRRSDRWLVGQSHAAFPTAGAKHRADQRTS